MNLLASIPDFAENPLWYAGLIWAMTLGWAASSYASAFAWRMPRGEKIFGRKPYCGACDTMLTSRDLFPVFSWLFSGGKCRHCGAAVPGSYAFFELIYSLYAALCYVQFGFGDMLLLMLLAGMLWQISLMMAWDDDFISPLLALQIAACGALFRLKQGGELTDAVMGMFLGMLLALLLYRVVTRQIPPKDVYALPHWVWLLMGCGGWLTFGNMVDFLPLWLALLVVLRFVLLREKSFQTALVLSLIPALLIFLWRGFLLAH